VYCVIHQEKNVRSYEYQCCLAAIIRTSSIKDQGVFFDSKLYFYNYIDFLFSDCIKLLGLIDYSTVLYFRWPKLEYASVVWNSITSTGANNLERI
jgi:hypothetical protein